jgi:hypothetical protein
LKESVRTSGAARRLDPTLVTADYWLHYLKTMADPQLSKVYSMGAVGRKELEQGDVVQFFFLCRATFMGCENQHYQYLRGLIDAKAYAGYEQTIKEQIAAFPGVRAMWQMVRHTYGPEFVTFMDAKMSQVSAHAPPSAFATWKTLVEQQKAGGERGVG